MLQLTDIPLTPRSVKMLNKYQDEIDSEPTFPQKIAKAKSSFKSKNTRKNNTFIEVKGNLNQMSGPTERCNYCEDSKGDEVEHIFPKNHYPELGFRWMNYCLACGPCNGPKNDQFAIFEQASGVEVVLNDLPANTQPPAGNPLLINPRTEDPTQYLFLDIDSSFFFTPYSSDATEIRRADYTIEVLGLNTRAYLVRARKVAFSNYKARVSEYISKRDAGAQQLELDEIIENFNSENHKTVWFEMKRQFTAHPVLTTLFNQAPEALTW